MDIVKHIYYNTMKFGHIKIRKNYSKINTNNKCDFIKNTGNCCEKNSTHIFKNKTEKKYYCNTHFKSELKKKLKNIHLNPLKI